MEITLDVKRVYRSFLGNDRSGPRDNPVFTERWSVVPAGPSRGAELMASAAAGLEQLGELMDHIETVELSFEKPTLGTMLWPQAVITVQAPGIPTPFKLHIKAGPGCDVREGSPFPSAQFTHLFIEETRRQLHLKITAHRESLDGLSAKLAPPAQADVA